MTQQWKKVGDVWEQNLGTITNVYASIAPPLGQPMHWMIVGAAKFRYTGPVIDLEATFKTSWIEMRYRWPVLASRIIGDKKTCLSDTGGTALASWLESSFTVHRDQTVGEVLQNLVHEPYITLRVFPSTEEVMITAPHSHVDGRGIISLIDRFFDTVATSNVVPVGEEHIRLPVTEDALLGWNDTISQDDINKAASLLGRLAQDQPIRMPVLNMSEQPSGSARQQLKIDQEASKDIVRLCKLKGYTVTSAWHVAVIKAVAAIQFAAGETGATFASFTNFDLRPYFADRFDYRNQPATCYHIGIPFCVEIALKSFDELSNEVNQQYRAGFGKDGVSLKILPAYCDLVIKAMAAGPPPSSTPVLSSLGVLEKFLNSSFGSHWEIENAWIADTMMTPEIMCFLWSWKDEIVLNGSYNSAFYSEADIRLFLDTIKNELFAGLGVESRS